MPENRHEAAPPVVIIGEPLEGSGWTDEERVADYVDVYLTSCDQSTREGLRKILNFSRKYPELYGAWVTSKDPANAKH